MDIRKELAEIQSRVSLIAIVVNNAKTVEEVAAQANLLARELNNLIKLVDELYVQTHKD